MKKDIVQPRPPARMAQHHDEVEQQQSAWAQQFKQKLLCCWKGDDKDNVESMAMSRVPSTRSAPARPRRPSEFELSERLRSGPEQRIGLARTKPTSSPIIESPTARLVPKEADQRKEEAETVRRRWGPGLLDSRFDGGGVDEPARASTPVPGSQQKMLARGDLKTLPSVRRRLEAQRQASGVDDGVEKMADPADVVSRGNV